MAIRKPVLSVKEARSLAAHRSDLLPSVTPHDPVRDPSALQPRPHTEDVPVAATTIASVAVDIPLPPTPKPEADPLAEVHPVESPGPEPVAMTAEVSPPQVSQADTSSRRKSAEKKSRKAAPDIGRPIAKRQKQQVIGKRSEEGKIQVFLSAALPARGISKSFERLCRQYAPAKSLQMILRRALDDYEVLLENGDLDNLPETYTEAVAPEVCGIIQTSRIMPLRLIERARAHFDPLGFESDRAFGRKLASAALAIFFEIQAQHQ
ncbi:VirC2 family conjugal transfer protein [Shinella kummerowiae]